MRTENTPQNAGDGDVSGAGPTPTETESPAAPARGAVAVAETPKRVASFAWCSMSPKPPRGPNSPVVGMVQTLAL